MTLIFNDEEEARDCLLAFQRRMRPATMKPYGLRQFSVECHD